MPFPALADDTARKMREAETHFSRGEYLEALGDYQEIIEQPKAGDHRPKALMMSATIYSTFLNDRDAALALYGQVRTKYPGSVYEADALFETAMIQYEKARYGEASRLFDLYLRKFPAGSRRDVAFFMRDASDHPPSERERREREQAALSKRTESIRVLVLEGATEMRVSSSSSLEIRNPNGGALLQAINTPQEARVRFDRGVLSVNGKAWPVTELVLSPARGGTVRVNGATYRGNLKLIVSGQGRINAVNLVDIEDYLYGVVPKEMSPDWPDEALKAQAVVSRTFARYQMDANASRDHDVSATTASQVYGGVAAGTDRTRRAVDATRGKILTFNGKPAPDLFSCQQRRDDGGCPHVWRRYSLSQKRSGSFSENAPGCRWSLPVSIEDLSKSLSKNGIRTNDIRDVVPVEEPFGEGQLKITHGGGDTVLRCNDFRTSTTRLLKSTLFVLTKEGDMIRFDGKGYGHGVGMSQWGAREMAQQGFSYGDILKYYYSKIEIGSLSRGVQKDSGFRPDRLE